MPAWTMAGTEVCLSVARKAMDGAGGDVVSLLPLDGPAWGWRRRACVIRCSARTLYPRAHARHQQCDAGPARCRQPGNGLLIVYHIQGRMRVKAGCKTDREEIYRITAFAADFFWG